MSGGKRDGGGVGGYVAGTDLTGYRVEVDDGYIGKISQHTVDVDSAHVVVDTGPWIFGRQVLLPVTTITRVDAEEETVWVSRTKEQVKNATGFDKDHHTDHREHHDRLDGYQAGGFAGEPHL
ncbi:PRC-barrel domain containing protein [Kitasatospora sp. NPDC096147]|uniref:PRC-barrel domain containing protein n=1 Tax=Kitasatospora sp. NPDC096147 TaxID=3364093 RepID=UPI0037F9C92D